MPYFDSTGKPIDEGTVVRWRGEMYTIKAFRDGEGRGGKSAAIEFEETPHIDETPDEWSVDIV